MKSPLSGLHATVLASLAVVVSLLAAACGSSSSRSVTGPSADGRCALAVSVGRPRGRIGRRHARVHHQPQPRVRVDHAQRRRVDCARVEHAAARAAPVSPSPSPGNPLVTNRRGGVLVNDRARRGHADRRPLRVLPRHDEPHRRCGRRQLCRADLGATGVHLDGPRASAVDWRGAVERQRRRLGRHHRRAQRRGGAHRDRGHCRSDPHGVPGGTPSHRRRHPIRRRPARAPTSSAPGRSRWARKAGWAESASSRPPIVPGARRAPSGG